MLKIKENANLDFFDSLDCTLGPAGETANKDVQCNLPASGVLRVGVVAINLTPIPDGVVASFTFHVKDDTPCDSTFTLMNTPTAADAVGNAVNVRGTNGEVSVLCDSDYDDICDSEDNCFDHYNPLQEDTFPPQGNGIGDACDCEPDFDCDGDVDAFDMVTFLEDFRRGYYVNPCPACEVGG